MYVPADVFQTMYYRKFFFKQNYYLLIGKSLIYFICYIINNQ